MTTPRTAAAPRKRAPAKATKAAPGKRATHTSAPAPSPSPGWYPDPAAPETQRYWDGEGWVGKSLPVNDPAPAGPAVETPAAGDPRTIVFQGRTMRVHNLSIEQIGVWRRVVRQFESVDELPGVNDDASDEDKAARNKTLQRLLDRSLDIILSVLVEEKDVDWVEDQLLTHKLTLNEAVEIINKTVGRRQADDAAGQAGRQTIDKARRRA